MIDDDALDTLIGLMGGSETKILTPTELMIYQQRLERWLREHPGPPREESVKHHEYWLCEYHEARRHMVMELLNARPIE